MSLCIHQLGYLAISDTRENYFSQHPHYSFVKSKRLKQVLCGRLRQYPPQIHATPTQNNQGYARVLGDNLSERALATNNEAMREVKRYAICFRVPLDSSM